MSDGDWLLRSEPSATIRTRTVSCAQLQPPNIVSRCYHAAAKTGPGVINTNCTRFLTCGFLWGLGYHGR